MAISYQPLLLPKLRLVVSRTSYWQAQKSRDNLLSPQLRYSNR